MSLKVCVQLLLSVTMMTSAEYIVNLSQTSSVSVKAGSSVTLECDLNCERSLNVLFERTSNGVSEKVPEDQVTADGRTYRAYLTNVTEKDSGFYFCNVTCEIPTISSKNSNGTVELIVAQTSVDSTTIPTTVSPTDEPSTEDWMVWVIPGGACLSVKLLLIMFLVFRRKKQKCRERQCPIYANARPVTMRKSPQPSQQAERTTTDGNLKTAASSQNLRSPSPNASRLPAGGHRGQ